MLLRDGLIYILAKLMPSLIGFVTTIGLTWILTPEAYGVYGFGLAAVALGSNILFDWHGIGFMRWYQSRGQEPGFMPTTLAIFAAACVLSSIAMGIALASGLLHGREFVAWILLPGTWAYAWFELAARVQVANFRPLRYLWMNLSRNLLILGSGLLVAYFSGSAEAVLAAVFASMLVAGCIYLGDGLIRPGRAVDWRLARMLVVYGAPICITTISSGLIMFGNRLLLAEWVDMRSVAYLTAAAALVQATIGVVGAGIGSATYSLAVCAVESGQPELARKQLHQNIVYLASILLPAAVGLSLVAPQLAQVLLRPEYMAAVTETTPWLAASAAMLAIRAHYVDHAFQLGNRTWLLARIMVVGALLNILLNCLLIPRSGYLGAAIAMTATAAIALGYAVSLSRRAYPLPFPVWDLARIGLATASMVAAIESVPDLHGIAGLGCKVSAGLLAYGLGMIVLHPGWARDALRRHAWVFARLTAPWRLLNRTRVLGA